MKKILLYLVISIVVVCCGISIYYVVRNDEDIHYTSSEASSIYLNVGEVIDIPVIHERPNRKTELEVNIGNDIVEVDKNAWTITAKKAGTTLVTITSSNAKFGPFEIAINIGNGSVDCPYYVRNEDDLQAIGSEKWSLSGSYLLTKDIEITKNFQPIGNTQNPFNGNLDGAKHSIKNLVINEEDSTSIVPCGIFRSVGTNGRIENLIIENADVKAKAGFAGIIVGKNYGLVGKCQIVDSKIENVLETASYTGLIAGLNESKDVYAGIRLCSAAGEIISKYVAGGATGWNKGGVLSNNYIQVKDASVTPVESLKSEALFGGLAGYNENADGEITRTIAINNLVKIEKLETNLNSSSLGGIFGYIYSSNKAQTQGYYSMLLYNTSISIGAVGCSEDEVEINGNSLLARNYGAAITNSQLTTKSTYTGISASSWEFTSSKKENGRWVLTNNKDIHINYDSDEVEYQDLPLVGTVVEIYDRASLSNAIDNMRIYPSAKITYVIKGSSEKEDIIDENGETTTVVKKETTYTYTLKTDWEPIGTKDNPFAGSIIAEDDATITIKGLNVDSEYTGLFGVLSNDSVISNVIISDAKLSGTMVGAIAAMQNSATIRNCTVKNSKIITKKYAGSIAGFSTGTISNCKVSGNEIKIEQEDEINIYLGGIVGKTRGIVSDSKSSKVTIDANSIYGKNMTLCMGGISGYSENASISNSETLGISINSKNYEGRAYGAGLIGYMINSNVKSSGLSIDLNDGIANQIILKDSHPYSIAGGLAGFMDGGRITKSSVGTAVINSHSSAGLVSFLTGEIDQCYTGTTTSIEGKNVGGFTCNLYGKISNSYTYAILNGSELEVGMTTYLWKGSEIDKCFTYCSFNSSAPGYADTLSNYKTRPNDFGSIDNSIFVKNDEQTLAKKEITDFYKEMIICRDGSKKVEVQIAFAFVANKYNYISESGLLGVDDNYMLFKQIGFDEEIWSFGSDEISSGISPTLKDAYDSEFGYITLSEGESTEDETPKEETIES